MLAAIYNSFRRLGARRARPAKPTARPRLEGLEDRRLMTTVGWVRGAPPTRMTFSSRLGTTLDPVGANRTLASVAVKDSVTRAVTFTAPTTGNYVIRTGQAAGRAAFDTVLGIYTSTGTRLAFNDDAGGSRFSALTVALRAGQTYQVGVGRYLGARPADAGTRFCSLTIDGPNDDRFEAQGGDAFATAVGLGTATTTATVSGLVMRDAADHFRFTLPAAAGATDAVSLAFQHAQGDLDLTLLDAAGTVRRTSDGTTNGERVSLAGLPAGDYVIKVYGYRGVTNPGYSMTITHTAPVAPTVPPTVDLGQQVVNWARGRLGQQVGDGECATLVDQALRGAGAKTFSQLGPTGADADYVWGTRVLEFRPGNAVSLLDQLRPGDIIQFRDVTLRTNVPGGFFQHTFPHHTAIVEANNGGGTLRLLESNLNGVRTVAQTVRPFADMTQGVIWVYRPVAA